METGPSAQKPPQTCPVAHCLSMIGGKWKPMILYNIYIGTQRFGAMQRAIPNVTKQMLTQHLRELEVDGLITRQIFAEMPPRVEYSLSARGTSILPVIAAMQEWGLKDQGLQAVMAVAE